MTTTLATTLLVVMRSARARSTWLLRAYISIKCMAQFGIIPALTLHFIHGLLRKDRHLRFRGL